MKLIPILYQTEMVQAIVKGWKTWTRRLKGLEEINKNPDSWIFTGSYTDEKGVLFFCFKNTTTLKSIDIKCPYGKPGDILWVRESWNVEQYPVAPEGDHDELLWYYKATEKVYTDMRWRPSIHLPFDACRIFLRIKTIKIERLKDISEAEAIAEGVYRWKDADEYFDYLRGLPIEQGKYGLENELHLREKIGQATLYKQYIHSVFVTEKLAATKSAKDSFVGLFLSISPNKVSDYNSPLNNPWVWCIEFEVLSTTGNPDPGMYKLPQKAKKYSQKQAKNIPV